MGSWNQLVGVAFGTSAILGCAFLLGKAANAAWGMTKLVVALVNEFTGQPARDGHEKIPSLVERIQTITEAWDQAGAALARLEALFEQQAEQLAQQAATLTQHGDRLTAMEERLAAVEGQLKKNGGNSVRDVLERVEAAVASPDSSPLAEAA